MQSSKKTVSGSICVSLIHQASVIGWTEVKSRYCLLLLVGGQVREKKSLLLTVPSLQPILDYIDRQYAAYYEAENHTGFRPDIRDTRIHACLYFIAPTGHW